MDKKSILIVSSVVILMSMQSCTSKNPLPKDPKAGQEYRDDKGNRWTWNPLGYWIVCNSLNNGPVSRYYPSTNTWTNSVGVKSSVPSTISPSMSSKLNNSFTQNSYKANSTTTTTKSSTSTSSSGSRRSGGFGTSSRSSIS